MPTWWVKDWAMAAKVRVGLIGCGNIAPQYVQGCRQWPILDLVACADIKRDRAEALADAHGLRALSVEALLADPAVDIVVNLTVPAVHAEVSRAILAAGKHAYSEKPLAVDLADGRRLLDEAAARGLLVGCAPDTFLGGGLQTCRHLIDQGAIGEPVGAVAFMLSRGPESWHPNPAFFYQRGAGPLFDMGPYYLTALISLLGPIRRVTGSARASFPERVAGSGERLPVDTPTYYAATLDFAAGPIGALIVTFDVWAAGLPRLEIYGAEGSLSVPDPNIFGGPVRLRRAGASAWEEIPLTHRADIVRGIGVADMAEALRAGRPPRASGALALHVLEAMHAIGAASDSGRHQILTTLVHRPAPLSTPDTPTP